MTHSLVETVTGRNMAELIAARDAATRADIVELRLDGVDDVDVSGCAERQNPPRHRDVPPGMGRRSIRWERGAAPRAAPRRRSTVARSTSMSNGAPASPTSSREIHGASCCRRMTFKAFRPILRAAPRRCGRAAPAPIKIAVTATRLSDALPLLPIGADGKRGRHRDG